jgi:hypothetical protein
MHHTQQDYKNEDEFISQRIKKEKEVAITIFLFCFVLLAVRIKYIKYITFLY